MIDELLKKYGLKKKDFKFNFLEKRVYGREKRTVFTWVEAEVNGKTYKCGDPYQGRFTAEVRDVFILSVLYLMEHNSKVAS